MAIARTVLAAFLLALVGGPAIAAPPIIGLGGPSRPAGKEASAPPAAAAGQQALLAKTLGTGLYMTGDISYTLTGGTATITLDGITNDSATRTTGDLRLSLWALSYQPVRGASLTGYRTATFDLLVGLQPRSSYRNVVSNATFTAPPAGNYWLVLALEQRDPPQCPANADGWCLEDTFTSFAQVTFGSFLPTYDYSDLWFTPSEAGWGAAILHHPSNIAFVAWYTYDAAGNPKWYVASSCPMVGDGCSGTLYETTGPPLGTVFNPTSVRVTAVGSVTLSFADRSNGLMSYNVRGVTATKAITRQSF